MDFSKLAKSASITPFPQRSQITDLRCLYALPDDLLTTVQRLTFHHITRGCTVADLGTDGTQLVELGFARFLDSKTKFKVMDEPLVILAAAHWLNHGPKKRTHYKLVANEMELHQNSAKFNGLENYIALALDIVLCSGGTGDGGVKVNELFKFCGEPDTWPAWSNLTAELVAIHRVSSSESSPHSRSHSSTSSSPPTIEKNQCKRSQLPSCGSSVCLGTNGTTPSQTLAWLEHTSLPLSPSPPVSTTPSSPPPHHPPFTSSSTLSDSTSIPKATATPILFPDTSMGPDLLFVLRLSDSSLIWVALQVKLVSSQRTLPKESLRRAIRSITPSCFYLKKDGSKHCGVGMPGLVDETLKALSALPNSRCRRRHSGTVPILSTSVSTLASGSTSTQSPGGQGDAGRYGLLRAIATFPALPALERCIDTEDDPEVAANLPPHDRHPIAVLNMELIKQMTAHLSPTKVLENRERGVGSSGNAKDGDVKKSSKKRKRGVGGGTAVGGVKKKPRVTLAGATSKGLLRKKPKVNLN